MKQKTRKFIILALLFLAAGCNQNPGQTITSSPPAYDYSHRLQIDEKILFVEVANASSAMRQGLSGRATMDEDMGMLFDFGKDTTPGFWMKDMKFDLDLIWIRKNKIIGVTANVPAPIENLKFKIENLPLYYPPQPVDSVLEVNAGWAEKNGIKINDYIILK